MNRWACVLVLTLWACEDDRPSTAEGEAEAEAEAESEGECTPISSSTLAGVRFDLSGNRCRYTLAEAEAGIIFVYRTIVESDVPDVEQELSPARCDPADPSGLLVELAVAGNEQEGYCFCDCGLGLGGTSTVDLGVGEYSNQLEWNGTNWSGPSDFGNPYGSPFPQGTYQFTAHAEGTVPGSGDARTPFVIDGTVEFELLP